MKTKKLITLLVSMLVMAMNSHGQFLRFGVKAGINTSNLTINDSDYKKQITGGHVGLWLNAPLPGAFSVQPELLFTQKGTKSVYDNDDGTTLAEIELGLNYLEMPVHLVYQVFRNVEIEAGPYWGYLINPEIETMIASGSGSLSFWDNLDQSDFERFDLGFSMGARVQFNRLYLGLSYKAGLEPVSKENNYTDVLFGEATNRTFQIYGALRF